MNMLAMVSASAPGKVILHGEHSVVFGKTALAASLGMRTTVKIQELETDNSETKKPTVNVFLPNLNINDPLSFDIQSLKSSIDLPLTDSDDSSWCTPKRIRFEEYHSNITRFLDGYKIENNLVLTDPQSQALFIVIYLYRAITNQAEYESKSLNLTVTSELTIGAGTGSSASYAVSLTAAVVQYLRMKSPARYFSALKNAVGAITVHTTIFSLEEKKIISEWAFCCEKIAHGTPSGVDNSTCTFGSLIEFRKGSEPIPHSLGFKLKIVLVDSCVSRQTKVLAEKVRNLKARHPTVVDSVLDTCDLIALSGLQVLKKLNENNGEGSDLAENYQKLAELFDMNHHLLASLGVSHPSLDQIRSLAAAEGFSSKLTGAGGGGYAIVLIPPQIEDAKVTSLLGSLNTAGFKAKLVHLGGSGVTVDEATHQEPQPQNSRPFF